MGVKEREPGGKEKWAKEGFQEDRRERGRARGVLVGGGVSLDPADG